MVRVNDEMLRQARRLQAQVERQRSRRREKKDAVLHLRLEADLMERVKFEAKAHGMSVSDFVRVHLLAGLAAPASDGAPAFLAQTSAWTDAVVMRAGSCAVCNDLMPKGARARLANGPPPPARLICGDCYERLLAESVEDAEPHGGDG